MAKREKSKERLSAVEVTSLAERKEPVSKLYHDGGGLYLSVDKRSHTASWVFRYTLDGKAHTLGLGSFPTVGLAKARRRAEDARRMKADRVDPVATQKQDKAAKRLAPAKAMTFKHCAEACFASHSDGWSAAHAKDWPNSLATWVYPLIGNTPVGEVDNAAVLRVLQQEVTGKGGASTERFWTARNVTAKRVRQRVEAVLEWAAASGQRAGDNPARWGLIKRQLPAKPKGSEVEHHAALPVDQLPAFMQALRARPGLGDRALELTILTVPRSGNVLNARWCEFDLEAAVWTVPGPVVKGRKEHRVPLSSAAVSLLKDLPRASDLVFQGKKPGRPLANNTLFDILRAMGRGDITTHGFRSTFRMWAAEQGVAREVAEASLAHALGDNETEAAYQRSDMLERRRKVMQAWADYAEGKDTGDNVKPMRKATAA